MTPNPNPSPELREAFDERARELFINNGGKHSSNCVTAWQLFQEFAALSPQTLPAPGEVDYAEAARVMFEASGDRFMRAEQCYPAIDALVTAQFIVPSNASTVPSSPTLATVAAANDEGVRALQEACEAYVAAYDAGTGTIHVNKQIRAALATSRSQHEGASS